MVVQVLVATMGQTDHSLIEKMNIQTDAIVANQCDCNSIEEFMNGENQIKYLNFAERGVGLNRNNALMRASGDVVLFADDDMVYVDGYANLLNKVFDEIPEADVIVFNISSRKPIKKIQKVGRLNYLRYGTARIAARRKAIIDNGIFFNLCFGGGTSHCHGEDNLFLTSCLDKGLKIYAYPVLIANDFGERESSWNKGYDEKYVKDQGVLYYQISRKGYKLLCFQDAFRRHKSYKMSPLMAFKLMLKGISENDQ